MKDLKDYIATRFTQLVCKHENELKGFGKNSIGDFEYVERRCIYCYKLKYRRYNLEK